MTLFSFEEKKEYELLDLIVKVIDIIDTSMKLDNNDMLMKILTPPPIYCKNSEKI